jgi:hypothetical protein
VTGAALVVVVVALLLLPGCGGDVPEQEPDKPPGTTVLDRGIRSLGDFPLVVITAARHREGFEEYRIPPRLRRAGDRLWGVLQAELAALSSDHAHVVALRSDHVVHRPDEQPPVVVRAVRAVVRAHRDGAPLPACEELFSGPGVRCRS